MSLDMKVWSDREIVFTRRFAAPQERVFDVFTRPEHIRHWMWADVAPLSKVEADVCVGGALRYEWTVAGGGVMGVSGTYLEYDRPHRTVHTEAFDEDWTDGETTVITEFEADGDGTLVTITIVYRSKDGRDAALKSEMADGMAQCYDRLDKYLAA